MIHCLQLVAIPNTPEPSHKQELTDLKKRTAALENRRARSRSPGRRGAGGSRSPLGSQKGADNRTEQRCASDPSGLLQGTDHLIVKSGCSLALALVSRCFWLFVFFWRFLSGSWSWCRVLALPRSVPLVFPWGDDLEPFLSSPPVPIKRAQIWRSGFGKPAYDDEDVCPLTSSSAFGVHVAPCIASRVSSYICSSACFVSIPVGLRARVCS